MPKHFHDSGTKDDRADDIVELLEVPHFYRDAVCRELKRMKKNELGNLLFYIKEKVEPILSRKVVINMDTQNDEFRTPAGLLDMGAVAFRLRALADRLEETALVNSTGLYREVSIMDANGNKVGTCTIADD
jgi:hypothetical protein